MNLVLQRSLGRIFSLIFSVEMRLDWMLGRGGADKVPFPSTLEFFSEVVFLGRISDKAKLRWKYVLSSKKHVVFTGTTFLDFKKYPHH